MGWHQFNCQGKTLIYKDIKLYWKFLQNIDYECGQFLNEIQVYRVVVVLRNEQKFAKEQRSCIHANEYNN